MWRRYHARARIRVDRNQSVSSEVEASLPSGTPHVAHPFRISLFFAATGGGVQRTQVTLANAFAARGLNVACVMPQAKGPFLDRLSRDVVLIDFGTRNPFKLVPRLVRYLRNDPPNALIAAQQHAILAAVWARRLAGSRFGWSLCSTIPFPALPQE